MFLVFAAALSVAVTAAMSTSAATRNTRVATDTMSVELDKVSAIDYGSLLSGAFTPPDLCPDSQAGSGVAAASCVRAAGRTVRITYSYQTAAASGAVTCGAAHPDPSAKSAGYVGVCATTTSLPGASPQVTRRINAPVAGYAAGEGSLRVTLSGAYSTMPGPLYLLPASSTATPVASGTPDSSGVVVMHSNAANCTPTAPCRLALATGNSPASVGGYALTGSTAAGPDAKITLTTGRLTETSATVVKAGMAQLQLWAQNDSGTNASRNPVTGSVCLWATFVDGGATRTVPVCNTGADPGVITVATYDPTWGTPNDAGLRFPLPTGVPIGLTVDSPDGSCPHAPGMLGSAPATPAGADHPADWLPAAVCASFTWGTPATWGPVGGQQSSFTGATLTLHDGATDNYKVIWSGPGARPAGGYGTDPTWAKPRQAVGCAFDATCRSAAAASPPETTECPNSYCLSAADAAPQLTAPANATVVLSSSGNLTTSFSLTFTDPESDPITATVSTLPQDGTLKTAAGSTIATGTTLISGAASPATVNLTYTQQPGTSALRWFTVKLTDTHGAARSVDVGLYHAVSAWTVTGTNITATQGDTGVPVSVTVTGTDGNPLASATVTFTSDPGVTFSSATVTTNASGVAATTVAFPTVTTGAHPITATAGGRSGQLTATVAAAPGGVQVSATGGPQGSAGTITVTTRDMAGAPMGGATVSLAALSGQKASDTVYPRYAGCVTGADGTCSVALAIDTSAKAGIYDVRATSGAFTATTQVTVTQVPGSIRVTSGGSLAERATSTLTAVVDDGAGDPVGGASLTVGTAPAGLTVTGSDAATGSDGTFHLTMAATADAPTGARAVPVTVAGTALTAAVTVTGAPATIAAAPASVAQGGSATLQVTVADGTGAPLPGASVQFTTTTSGLKVGTRAGTDSSGTARTLLSADASTPTGTYTVGVTAGPVTITASVAVTPTPTSVSISGALTQGGNSSLIVTVVDGAGAPVPAATVTLTGLPASVSSTQATTTSTGEAVVTATDNGPTAAGTYTIGVTVSGATLPGSLTVVAQPGAITPAPATVTLAPGATATMTVTVTDKAGAPLPGASVTVSGLPAGVTATTNGPADAAGNVQVTFTSTAGTPACAVQPMLTAGPVTRTFTLTCS